MKPSLKQQIEDALDVAFPFILAAWTIFMVVLVSLATHQ